MKQFCCGDVIPGCRHVFEACSEAELLERVSDHGREEHDIGELTSDLEAAIRSHIVDA
ncbi:MAG: DUF1059 domain-containing protein [Acidimicrobiales bacterium]